VIGTDKFSYDVWGDSVNIASRMESHGRPARIQVSEMVRDRLQSSFSFEERGEVEVKNIGAMRTYLLR
jgi:class 3 adenylate cyclase